MMTMSMIWIENLCKGEKLGMGSSRMFKKTYKNKEMFFKWLLLLPKVDENFEKIDSLTCPYCGKKEIDYLYAGMMQGKSISEPMVQQGNKKLNEKREHPTQKPILLWDLILTFCIENNIDISTILDTNSGLCSLGLSALKFEEVKEIVMCDIDDEYYKKSKKRIKNKISQLEIKFID